MSISSPQRLKQFHSFVPCLIVAAIPRTLPLLLTLPARQFCFCCWVLNITRTLLLAPPTEINSIIRSSSRLILQDHCRIPSIINCIVVATTCATLGNSSPWTFHPALPPTPISAPNTASRSQVKHIYGLCSRWTVNPAPVYSQRPGCHYDRRQQAAVDTYRRKSDRR